MSHTLERCEHDSIKWFPRVTVEKYSPDQSAWAERKLAEELSWGRRLLVTRFGVRVPRLHGDWLREVFREPENGFAYTEGNQLVNGGLDALTGLINAAGSKQALAAGNVLCGVGAGTTAWAATQAALVDDNTANCFYMGMDSTYPKVNGSVHGELDGQATFASANANGFAWQEWCWASSTAAVTNATTGTQLSATGTGAVMFNRWTGTSLGTKGSGATWVFSTTITFSLYSFVPNLGSCPLFSYKRYGNQKREVSAACGQGLAI